MWESFSYWYHFINLLIDFFLQIYILVSQVVTDQGYIYIIWWFVYGYRPVDKRFPTQYLYCVPSLCKRIPVVGQTWGPRCPCPSCRPCRSCACGSIVGCSRSTSAGPAGRSLNNNHPTIICFTNTIYDRVSKL